MSDPLPEGPTPDIDHVTPESPMAEPPIAESAPAARRRRDPLPFLIVFGILVLCAAAVFLWRHPLGSARVAETRKPALVASAETPPSPPQPVAQAAASAPAVDPAQQAQIAALAQQVASLTQQVASASDLASRVATLEKQPAPTSTGNDALAGQVGDLATRQASEAHTLSDLTAQVAALKGRLDGVTASAARTVRIARIQAAEAALELGQPLGDIDGAPPAVVRYGTAAPPTVAALRLQFPSLAAEAEAASRPRTDTLPFWQAVKLKAEQLVVIRRGDRVLVGAPDAGVIARASDAVAAGDLAAAVAVLDGLTGAPAAILADWKTQAENLLAARKALAAMAASA